MTTFYDKRIKEIKRFKLSNKDKNKEIKHYLRTGYTYNDMWNIDKAIAKYSLPLIKDFKKYSIRYNQTPNGVKRKEWLHILDEILWSLEQMAKEYYNTKDMREIIAFHKTHCKTKWEKRKDGSLLRQTWDDPSNEIQMNEMYAKYHTRLNEGLAYFGKYLTGLWS